MSIIIFAGHHPAKPGEAWNGFSEHDEARRWLALLRGRFAEEDLIVGPEGVLRTKVEFVNARKPILSAELHFNSTLDPEPAEGSETLYCPGSERGRIAAEAVQGALGEAFSPSLGVREGYYRGDERRGPDWFLARTKSPALIVLPEFIHNKTKIVSGREAGVERLALGLALAIEALS